MVANGNGPPLEIIKKFLDRTSPQGSSLSPKFWRFYDGVFTALYKSSLDTYANAHPNVVLKRHRSFAEDKLTFMLLRFSRDTPTEVVGKIAVSIAKGVRNLLDSATKALGCGINRDKSEIILPDPFCNTDPEPKNEFVWLGYSLKLTLDFQLLFTESRCQNKINLSRILLTDIFQYTRNILARFKIYKIFIAPVIEVFIPAYIMSPMDGRNTLNKFHQGCQNVITRITLQFLP